MRLKIAIATPGRDLARFGLAIALAASFSTVQVFVIPRRLDLVTYGQYRLFLVYVTYLELLNLGIADGAFLRWAGREPDVIQSEWRTVGRRLLAISIVQIVAASVAAAMLDPGIVRLFVVSFAAAALCVNAQVLSSYALQAAGDFRAAGRIAVLAPGLFVLSIIALPVHTLAPVLGAFVASLAVAALYAAYCVTRVITVDDRSTRPSRTDDDPTVLSLIPRGAPVLGASVAAVLSRSVDRVIVSLATPITSFARYGFAATVMVTANVATLALSRVALSHAARRPSEERAKFLGGFLDIIAAGYGLALVGEPLFEHLVARFVPLYVVALPIMRALLVGLPFTVATQVVLVGTLQSYGMVRRQLGVQLAGVALAVVACGSAVMLKLPLWEIALAATIASALTFAIGVLIARRAVDASRVQAPLRFVAIVAAQSVALGAGLASGAAWPLECLICAALVALPTLVVARSVRDHGW